MIKPRTVVKDIVPKPPVFILLDFLEPALKNGAKVN